MTYINFPNPSNIPTTNVVDRRILTAPNQVIIQSHTTVSPPKVSLSGAFKPKKAGKNTSHIVFVLDDSASMRAHAPGTISGFNEFLKSQKQDAIDTGIETFVTLFKFDGGDLKCVYMKQKIEEAEELTEKTYTPNGWSTNLYDAMGGAMMKINELLSETKKKDRSSIIVNILTDGRENSSKVFEDSEIKKMIEKAEAKNWSFMFLGANINAVAESSKLGFSVNNTMQYTTQNISETIATASAMTSRLKSGYARGLDSMALYETQGFTEAERKTAVGDKDV